jgi:hypothetical protein
MKDLLEHGSVNEVLKIGAEIKQPMPTCRQGQINTDGAANKS